MSYLILLICARTRASARAYGDALLSLVFPERAVRSDFVAVRPLGAAASSSVALRLPTPWLPLGCWRSARGACCSAQEALGDGQTGRQADQHMDGQADGWMDRQAGRLAG
jgi:hypothetical protein